MYERFYELRERPFALSPDPDYLYPSRVHREALDYLRYGLESHAGFVVITGEIGSGKTTLLQTLLRGLDSQTTVGRIVNTMLEPRELLETIMIDFGLDPAGRSKPMMLRDLAQYLVDQRLAGRLILLVIDEAQNLVSAALEELRMLSNLETEKSKLLQIVLVGQPNLRDKLAAPELEQLRQRITVSYHLTPLEPTRRPITSTTGSAAASTGLRWSSRATSRTSSTAAAGGFPRIINVICDATLVFGYAEERRQIDAGADGRCARRARGDRRAAGGPRPPSRGRAGASRAPGAEARRPRPPVAAPRAGVPPPLAAGRGRRPDGAGPVCGGAGDARGGEGAGGAAGSARADAAPARARAGRTAAGSRRRIPAAAGAAAAAPRRRRSRRCGTGRGPQRRTAGTRFTPAAAGNGVGRFKRLMLGTRSALEEN